MSLEQFWAVAPCGGGVYNTSLTEDWYQGHGVYGGLVAAMLARALTTEVGPDRPLRTIHVSFAAPATAGPAQIHVSPVRIGRSVAVLSAQMRIEGRPVASAQATFAAGRDIRFHFDHAAPQACPPPESVADGPQALYLPRFCQFFEFRQFDGPTSFTGGEDAHLAGWCRPRIATPLSAELVLALLDAWAPAALSRRAEWAPCASIDLSADLPASYPTLPPDTFYHYVADATQAHGGYADERASLWSPSGVRLGRVRQLIALFDPPPDAHQGSQSGSSG